MKRLNQLLVGVILSRSKIFLIILIIPKNDKFVVEMEPFPHLVIENALPPDIYQKLYDEFPRIEYFNKGGIGLEIIILYSKIVQNY